MIESNEVWNIPNVVKCTFLVYDKHASVLFDTSPIEVSYMLTFYLWKIYRLSEQINPYTIELANDMSMIVNQSVHKYAFILND